MIAALPRGPAGLSCRRCLAAAWLPTLAGAVLATGMQRWLQPDLGGDNAPAAASPWLSLPMLVASMTCALVAAVFWPTFARGRPGRPWIDRAQRGWSGGLGAVMFGALLGQFALTLPLTTLLAASLGAPAAASTQVPLQAEGDPLLDAGRPRLRFVVPTADPVCELRLRPLVGLPDGPWVGTTIDVFADGERLPGAANAIADNRQLVRLQFPARRIRELTLVRTGGTVPLVFPQDAASLVGEAVHSRFANGALLAVLALLPTFVALALGALCGLGAGLPTVVAVVATALFLQTVAGLGGFAGSVLAVLRGHWLATATVFPRCAPSLAVGCVAMILTMLLRGKVER